MQIEYKPETLKQLKKLPQKEQKKVLKKIVLLSQNPHSGKNLKGELDGLKSFRAWPYRIIYEINKGSLIIFTISHRQGVYK